MKSNIATLEKSTSETLLKLANTESNNLVLKKQLIALEAKQLDQTAKLPETGSNVLRIDPHNLPIVSASADVSFFFHGTNSPPNERKKAKPSAAIPTDLDKIAEKITSALRFKDPVAGDYPIMLECEHIKKLDFSPESKPLFIVNMMFRSTSGLGAAWRTDNQSNRWKQFSVKEFDNLTEGEIPIPIAGPWQSAGVLGMCTVILNGNIERRFSIDPIPVKGMIILRPVKQTAETADLTVSKPTGL